MNCSKLSQKLEQHLGPYDHVIEQRNPAKSFYRVTEKLQLYSGGGGNLLHRVQTGRNLGYRTYVIPLRRVHQIHHLIICVEKVARGS